MTRMERIDKDEALIIRFIRYGVAALAAKHKQKIKLGDSHFQSDCHLRASSPESLVT